jgi:hypothetical protein
LDELHFFSFFWFRHKVAKVGTKDNSALSLSFLQRRVNKSKLKTKAKSFE